MIRVSIESLPRTSKMMQEAAKVTIGLRTREKVVRNLVVGFGLVAYVCAVSGCLGGNALIGISHGAIIVTIVSDHRPVKPCFCN